VSLKWQNHLIKSVVYYEYVKYLGAKIFALDLQAYEYTRRHPLAPLIERLMLWITHLAAQPKVIAGTIIIFILSITFNRFVLEASVLLCVSGFGGFLGEMIKRYFKRPRPFEAICLNEVSYSFPSLHALQAICCYGTLFYFIAGFLAEDQKKILYVLTVLLILLLGISRLALKVHYLSDVLGGYLLAFPIWITGVYVYEQLKRYGLN
jgi:undecaprenyl-diphosphatase